MMLGDAITENGENSQTFRRQDSFRKVLPPVPSADPQLNISAKMINRRIPSSKANHNYAPFIIEYSLLAEYNLLCKQKLPGIYVIPAAKTPFQWLGIIFVRQGFYQEGIFRFTLHIPDNFPDGDVAKIIFHPTVFHPLIKFETGELDVKRGFPKWRRNVNHLWQMILFARQIFYKIDISNPVNPDASRLFENDIEMFKHKVSKCVAHCKQHLYDEPDNDDPHAIRFVELENSQYEDLKKSITSYKSVDRVSPKQSHSNTALSWIDPDTLETFAQDKNTS